MTADDQLIYRSVVRPVTEDQNLRADEEDEEKPKDKHIFSESDFRDNVTYPEFDPEEIIGFKFIKAWGGTNY